MQRSRRLLLCALVAALSVTGCKNTGFLDSANPPVITKAGTWLTSQQLADGSFEVGGFAGFETPDAIVAIAERAQTSSAWDTTKARNGVLAVTKNGKSALDAMDDFADGTLSAGQAAKLIVLVATPLGLDSLAFDPQGDGARNLVGVLNQGEKPDGSFGAFNATLYAAIAKRILGAELLESNEIKRVRIVAPRGGAELRAIDWPGDLFAARHIVGEEQRLLRAAFGYADRNLAAWDCGELDPEQAVRSRIPSRNRQFFLT